MVLIHNYKYGKLTYSGDTIDIDERSSKKVPFVCDCGTLTSISFRNVVRGYSKSCGKCSAQLVKTGDTFWNLTWIGPNTTVQPESQKKFAFQCSCGKIKEMRVFTVMRGRAKTCGQCNVTRLRYGDKIHKFTYIGSDTDVYPGSSKKLEFRCFCGKTTVSRMNSISTNSTCGRCDNIDRSPNR
jgi:predicted SprT family Zn-dependent metalloprotease